MNEKDIVWSSLINQDDGILSTHFAHVYWPESEKKIHVYRNIAEKFYRECSQFVHGNSKTHESLPKEFGYSKQVLQSWRIKLDTVTMLFIYTFVLRFNDELTRQQYENIAPPLTDILGHISEVRELIKSGGK